MQDPESQSHSTMSSSGKAAAPSSCLSSQCFDLLTRSCVKCTDLFKNSTTEPASAASISTPVPTLPSEDLLNTILIFGVPVVVGIILALAALWGFLACKARKQRRKRKVADEEDKANMDTNSPLPSLVCQDPAVPERDIALALAPCPHVNGGLKTPEPPGKSGTKQRPCCQGDDNGDIVLLSAIYPCHEEYNHSFPLPATELGATVLVTTKTTQNFT